MSIKEELKADLVKAMKAKNKHGVSAIRMVNGAIKNREIEIGRELTDEEVVTAVASEIKKMRESARMFSEGGRQELADEESAQTEVLLAYMPTQLDETEIGAIVDQAIEESGAEGMKDMGNVMKLVMPKVRGKADGAVVNNIVKSHLQK